MKELQNITANGCESALKSIVVIKMLLSLQSLNGCAVPKLHAVLTDTPQTNCVQYVLYANPYRKLFLQFVFKKSAHFYTNRK